MRHGKAGRKLNRTASHRKATLSALGVSLLRHKRITTTAAKAKETRSIIEPLITKAKNAVAVETEDTGKNVHARRHVFSVLRDRTAVTTLFDEVAPKVASRPGGYTRVIKLGRRRGDGAEMAVIELVDFNIADEKPAKSTQKKRQKPGLILAKTQAFGKKIPSEMESFLNNASFQKAVRSILFLKRLLLSHLILSKVCSQAIYHGIFRQMQ